METYFPRLWRPCLRLYDKTLHSTTLQGKYACRLTVSKAPNAIHGRHLDHEGEDVVNEGVESLVGHHSPGKVSHRLELVVDEQLRRHHDKPFLL